MPGSLTDIDADHRASLLSVGRDVARLHEEADGSDTVRGQRQRRRWTEKTDPCPVV